MGVAGGVPRVSFVAVYCGKFGSAYRLVRSLRGGVRSVHCRAVIMSGTSHRSRTTGVHRHCPSIVTVHDGRGGKFSNNGGVNVQRTGKGCVFLVGGSACVRRSAISFLVRQLRDHTRVKNMSPGVHFTFPPRGVRFTKFAPLAPVALHGTNVNFNYPSGKAFSAPRPAPCLRKTTVLIGHRIVRGMKLVPRVFFLCCRRLS